MKYKNWTVINWPSNSAIPFKCEAITLNGYTIILHKKFICTNSAANNNLGEWEEGETFEFTVKGQYSGSLPNITDWDKAKEYIENYKVL